MSAISFHRCELWDLACDKMADFCTAWRKGVRRKRNIPSDTHCYILPLLCECLPVYDEVCRRSINFLRTCVSHRSKVVRCVANYGIFVWTMWLSCCIHYVVWINIALHSLLSPMFESLVCENAAKDIFIQREQSVDLLHKCIMIRSWQCFYSSRLFWSLRVRFYRWCVSLYSFSLCLFMYSVYELHNIMI